MNFLEVFIPPKMI